MHLISTAITLVASTSAHNWRSQPWRSHQGLNIQTVPHLIDESGNKHFKHSFLHEHETLGTTSLSYMAVIPPHVKVLDDIDAVVDVSCPSDKTLLIHISSSSNLNIEINDIIIASSGFGCHTHQPSGRDHGRHLHEDGSGGHSIIRRVRKVGEYVEVEEEEGALTIKLETEYAEFQEALLESDVDFVWTPPLHGEDPLVAARGRNEMKERHLLDIDTLIDSCKDQSSLDFAGNSDINCELNERDLFDFYADLFSVNYDPVMNGAKERTIWAMQDTVRCDDCYAALNLEIAASLKTSNYNLDKFKVQVTGNVHAQTAVTVTDPTEHIEAFLNRAFQELDVGGCMQTIEFWVSYVPIRIKPCWDMAVEFESSQDIKDFSVRSGFVFDANATMGVEFNKNGNNGEGSWDPIKSWNWDLDFYQPLWHTPGLSTDSMMRFYVIPQMTFTMIDVIPLLVYPKPYLGIDFQKKPSTAIGRTPSEGQGTWKVHVKKGNGWSDPGELMPDVYVVAEILGCTTTVTTNAETTSANLLYTSQSGGSNLKSGAAFGDAPIVNNPGCKLKTSVDSNDFDPEWDEWLIFENAPMFRWEAALDERVKITVWDSEDGNWFDQTDDKLEEMTYDALAAAGDDVVHTQTLDFGGGKTLEVVIKWELWNPEAVNSFVNGYAPEPVDGCWRPEGVSKCQDFHEVAVRKLEQTCEVDNVLTTCECEGLNAHLNYGFDIEVGVGEIDLPFEISLDGYDNGMDYSTKRLFEGVMAEFIVIGQSDLVCLFCEGCVGALADSTSNSGWVFSRAIDPVTGMEEGWVQEEDGGWKEIAMWVGVGVGCVALVGTVLGAVVYRRGGAKGGGGGGKMDGVGSWLGFKAGTGGAKRGSAYAAKNKKGGSSAMQMQGTSKGKRGSQAGGKTAFYGGNDREYV
ncbi:hypothetical protein TL16_g08649 [Triparma laevis f. inornata]|uniref:C2 domain-containing protein n=1 Tax=Triparma laevis f. inornata TaxID=1714386 RepID=A0A9W7AYM1_9STRA|nr:hypothetical protein TL16_g08649 [Triparma laevis f. inornata]